MEKNKYFHLIMSASNRNTIFGIRSNYDPKQDRSYNRFKTEYLKTTGKTHLLTDETREQLANVFPSGTFIPTGKQIRSPYLNDGSIPDYPQTPLSISTENRMNTEPTMKNTTLRKKQQEEFLKELDRPKENNQTFNEFFKNEIEFPRKLKNLIEKQNEQQKHFNNTRDKNSLVHEELLNKVQQDKQKNERKDELNRLEKIIKSERKEKFINNLKPIDIQAKISAALGKRGGQTLQDREDNKLRRKAINQVEAEKMFPLKRNEPLLTDEIEAIKNSKKTFAKALKQQKRNQRRNK